MSVREASPASLREGARALLGLAAAVGESADRLQRISDGAVQEWWGPNTRRWEAQAHVRVAAVRQVERTLRALAAATTTYADAVERAQGALRSWDVELDRLHHQLSFDVAAHFGTSSVSSTALLRADQSSVAEASGRIRWIEQDAGWAAVDFAARVGAVLEELQGSSFLSGLSNGGMTFYEYGHALPSSVATLGSTVQSMRKRPAWTVPHALRVPPRAAVGLGAIGVVLDAQTLWKGSGNDGARGGVDRAMAGVGLASVAASGAVAVGTAAGVTVLVAAAPAVAAVATGVALVTAGWGVGSFVYDTFWKKEQKRRPPAPLGPPPRLPAPRLTPTVPQRGLPVVAAPVSAPAPAPGRAPAPARSGEVRSRLVPAGGWP